MRSLSFASLPFLYYFLPVVLAVYFLVPSKGRNGVLLAASLVFYGWVEGLFLLLLTACAVNSGVCGWLIQRMRGRPAAKRILVLSLGVSLGLLFVFRYLGFFWGEFRAATGLPVPLVKLVCPVGIGFYTLQGAAYVLGVWRGTVTPRKGGLSVALYLMGFPWVLAGPMMPYASLAGQLDRRTCTLTKGAEGLRRLVVGLGKKCILAQTLWGLCQSFQEGQERTLAFCWLYALALVLALYFDFSGYTDMALGVGKLLGFDLAENFRWPLAARTLTDFWRRWHITLGWWFRDHLYRPLVRAAGGKRTGCLLLVWLLVGLWHGAGWNFLLWGLLFGLLLAAERLGLGGWLNRVPPLGHLFVLAVLGFGAVLLTGEDLGQSLALWGGLLGQGEPGGMGTAGWYALRSYGPTLLLATLGATPWPSRWMARLRRGTWTGKVVAVAEPLVLVVGGLLATLSVWAWVQPPKHYSETEERGLAWYLDPKWEDLADGSFAGDFAQHTQDQFPLRDSFRTVKGLSALKLLGQKDLDHLYQAGTYLAQMESPLRPEMLDHAAKKIQWVYDTYLAGTDVTCYLSMIPGKNAYLAEEYGYPSLDYGELFQYMRAHTPPMEYVDITDLLSLEDYYNTDSHWRQEKILDVAQRLAGAMGAEIDGPEAYHVQRLARPFTGRYAIQMGLTMAWEDLYYLTSPTLDQCLVAVYDQGGRPQRKKVYEVASGHLNYPYVLFLSGSKGLVTVKNLQAPMDKNLILFRDSYGSSLAPLLASGYRTITLVDLRYLSSSQLDQYIDFEDQDVLFLYSTLLLNNSLSMR